MTAKRRLVSVGVVVGLMAGATLLAASPVSATYPGKNGKIVFASSRSGSNRIFVMEPDGSGVTQITNSPGSDDRGASWSADGKRIVFVRTIAKNNDIWVMNADGSDQRQLTNTPGQEASPHFSPDGEKIAFVSNRDGDNEIFVMNDDGTGQTQLTFDTLDDRGPHFSPSGKTIVFSEGGPGDIYVMDADGSDRHQLTNTPSDEASPDYSPDGEKILFITNRIPPNYDVFVMDADGSDPKDLTNNPAGDFGAHFSPDGERIVFSSDRTGFNNVFVMNADGSGQTNISNSATTELGPDWQPRSVDGDVTVTKSVNGTPPPGASYDVKVVCDNGDDEFTKTLTFGETGGTQSFERESFGPLECEVTETITGGATTIEIACTNAKNAECGQEPGHFVLFDDPGGDKTKIAINVTNTFPVTVEPTFTG